MESVIAGLVILGALKSTSKSQRFGIVCSVDGRWNKAKHVFTGVGNAVTGLGVKAYENDGSDISVVQSGQRNDRVTLTDTFLIDDRNWRHIIAEQGWLDALTPLIPQWMNEAKTTLSKSTMIRALANVFMRLTLGSKSTTLIGTMTAGIGYKILSQSHQLRWQMPPPVSASGSSTVLLNTTPTLGQNVNQ